MPPRWAGASRCARPCAGISRGPARPFVVSVRGRLLPARPRATPEAPLFPPIARSVRHDVALISPAPSLSHSRKPTLDSSEPRSPRAGIGAKGRPPACPSTTSDAQRLQAAAPISRLPPDAVFPTTTVSSSGLSISDDARRGFLRGSAPTAPAGVATRRDPTAASGDLCRGTTPGQSRASSPTRIAFTPDRRSSVLYVRTARSTGRA